MVTLAGVEPGAPLDAARTLADELDARRVPLTLLVGARPHPEVAAWATARRRAGDATLLHGHGVAGDDRRLPAHEAGLRLTGALRARDGAGLPVDGFAAPGWAVSPGLRRALGAAPLTDLAVLVDASGVHRLAPDATVVGSLHGVVVGTRPATRVRRLGVPTRVRRPARARDGLVHLTAAAGADPAALLVAVDDALAAEAVPAVPAELVPARPAGRRGTARHPELWSITA